MTKKQSLCFILFSGLIYVFLILVVVIVDPYMHFHKPLAWLNYMEGEVGDVERYINDGVIRHYEYDGLIIGSSQTINFRCAEAQTIFGGRFIRVSQQGARYKEIDQYIKKALKLNKDVNVVIRPLDDTGLVMDKNETRYDDYPYYLYDDKLINDVSYIFNIHTIIDIQKMFRSWRRKEPRKTFDDYWMTDSNGVEWIRKEANSEIKELSKEDKLMIDENLKQNVISTVEENPSVQFYYFFVPYSVVALDEWRQEGSLQWHMDAQMYAIQSLLKYENLHLFSFYSVPNLFDDLDNYINAGHYNAKISSAILSWMHAGKYELTQENISEYENYIEEHVISFDYDKAYNSFNK